jgi:hypothetical protein
VSESPPSPWTLRPPEVEPCPACGYRTVCRDCLGEFWVSCPNTFCAWGGPSRATAVGAINAWNRVAASARLAAEIVEEAIRSGRPWPYSMDLWQRACSIAAVRGTEEGKPNEAR